MEAQNGNEQMMQLIPDQSYLQDRADQMSQVEENIVELGKSISLDFKQTIYIYMILLNSLVILYRNYFQ